MDKAELKKIIINEALGRFEGAEDMLRRASEFIFNNLDSEPESLEALNDWCTREHERNKERLTREIEKADKL